VLRNEGNSSKFSVFGYLAMGIILLETGSVEVKTLQDDGAGAVRDRLRVLLEVAVAIGRREGLLGNREGAAGKDKKDTIEGDHDDVAD
jgi:hypothetical protein